MITRAIAFRSVYCVFESHTPAALPAAESAWCPGAQLSYLCSVMPHRYFGMGVFTLCVSTNVPNLVLGHIDCGSGSRAGSPKDRHKSLQASHEWRVAAWAFIIVRWQAIHPSVMKAEQRYLRHNQMWPFHESLPSRYILRGREETLDGCWAALTLSVTPSRWS